MEILANEKLNIPKKASTQHFSFSKQYRLLNPSQFQNVFNNSEIKLGNKFILLLAVPNSLDYSRLGLVIPKKKVKRAVDRNRYKRLLREKFRQFRVESKNYDVIALARANICELDQVQQSNQIKKIFDNFQKKQYLDSK